MKTKLTVVIVLFLALLTWSYSAMGAPYLVSDPSVGSDNVTSCVFESFQLPCVLDATKAIRVDLAALPAGAHSVRAQFCNGLWGCSIWSDPMPFQKPVLSGPKTIKLSK